MKALQAPVFILCCLLFVLHQLGQKVFHLQLPLLDAYLDNFLAMPILLTLWLMERRLLFRKGTDYQLSAPEVGVATLWVALISELVFPLLSSRFTADWRDVIVYILGSLLYFYTINRIPSEKSRHP